MHAIVRLRDSIGMPLSRVVSRAFRYRIRPTMRYHTMPRFTVVLALIAPFSTPITHSVLKIIRAHDAVPNGSTTGGFNNRHLYHPSDRGTPATPTMTSLFCIQAICNARRVWVKKELIYAIFSLHAAKGEDVERIQSHAARSQCSRKGTCHSTLVSNQTMEAG